MRAWRVHELGEPEAVLHLDDVDSPVAGPGEAAASLNFPDVLMCRGEYQVKPALPFTPGAEVSGVVSALGDGVDADLLGRRVIAIPRFGDGGFTEETVAPVSTVFPIPDSLDDAAAAALHVTYQTGHVALHRKKGGFVEVPPSKRDPTYLPLEEEADRFASRMLIPSRFDRRLRHLSLEDVPSFARQLGIAPAMVVGRLQHDELLPYNRGNDLRRRLEFAEEE